MYLDDAIILKSKGSYKEHFKKIKCNFNQIIMSLINNLKSRFDNLGFIQNFEAFNF